MPKLIKDYIRNCLFGFGLSALFVTALLVLDVAGLRGLILGSSMGWIAAAMLFVANGIVFAGVQFAIFIMSQADDGPSGGKHAPEPVLRGVAVPVCDSAQAHGSD